MLEYAFASSYRDDQSFSYSMSVTIGAQKKESMNLPETYMSEDGLTVDGAGPELLHELLAEYEAILERTDPRSLASLQPGLTRDDIVQRLDGAELAAPEELIVWWTWRNGYAPMTPHGLMNPQLSLELALIFRSDDEDMAFENLPSPSWLRVMGHDLGDSVGVTCDEKINPPWVRTVNPQFNVPDLLGPENRAVSLCTVMTWQLLSIQEGWAQFDAASGMWNWENYAAVPAEWRATRVL